MDSPDPVVTASVYGGGALDALLRDGVYPAMRVLNERDSADWQLWFVRYARGGEHLKLRLHGPAAAADRARTILADSMCRALEEPCASSSGAPRISRPDAPPIDPEDEAEGDVPRGTVLWTAYRRSPVTLGPAPWPQDDDHALRFARAMAAGAQAVLEAVSAAAPGGLTPGERQRVVLRLLVEALGAVEVDRAAYLAYHRDWLLRFTADDADREAAARAAFDAQAARAGAAVAALAEALDAAGAPGSLSEAGFGGCAAALHRHAATFRGDPSRDVDPFAPDVSFPPLFKLLHGVANMAGLAPAAEAYLHHLLLRADGARGEALAA